MTIFTDGLRQGQQPGIDELPTSLGESLGAHAGEAFESLPLNSLYRIGELSGAGGRRVVGADPYGLGTLQLGDEDAAIPDVPIDQARARVKDAGLESVLHLPAQPSVKAPVLDIMMSRARERREREATIARGPDGVIPGALGVGTSLLVSAVDPLNVAAAFIPVIGEARYAKLMASAGESVLNRAAVRAGTGAASGAVGMAAIEPLEYIARNQEGQDYTFADALRSVMYGAALGGVLHAGGGAIADVYRGRKGKPLYPFAEGEPFAPVHLPEPLAAAGFEPHQVVPEQAFKPGGVELGFEAFHGSPFDFDAFDSAHLGRGEGSQSRGVGMYFAENEAVAADYRQKLTETNGAAGEAAMLVRLNRGDIAGALDEARGRLAKSGNLTTEAREFNEDVVRILEGGKINRGNVYRVRIDANPDHFLDWDKPLREQSSFVRKALEEHPNPVVSGTAAKWGHDVGSLYHRLAQRVGEQPWQMSPDGTINIPNATNVLRDAGIAGIKYLDQGSRSGGEGTRNFVVFDDSRIKITHKNGKPIEQRAAAKPAANANIDVVRSTRERQPQSLLEFIKARGGISDKDPLLADVLQSFGGKGGKVPAGLVRPDGLPLDRLRETAVELGYLQDPGAGPGRVSESTISDLLDAIDAEARGTKQYPAGSENFRSAADEARIKEQNAIELERLHDEAQPVFDETLEHYGIAHSKRDMLKARAFERMKASGRQDAAAAMEDTLASGNHIPKENPFLDALEDLPPRMREDALRASIARVTAGEPVRTGEILAAAAKDNPRLASLSAEAREWPQLPQGARFAGNGDSGPIIEGLQGRWHDAVDWLTAAQSGDARGVLNHQDVPDGAIDVIWGKGGQRGFGLAHIAEKHPEVMADLPDRLAHMKVFAREPTRIQLESPDGFERAAIALELNGEPKTWLLTAFDRRAKGGGFEPPPTGGSRDPSGLRPAADLQTPLSRYYGGEGEPGANLGRPRGDVDSTWRDLAQERPEFDSPEVLDASAAAGRLAEPGSVSGEPSARLAAAEKALADADAEWKVNEAYLPDDLKARVERDIKALDLEAGDRDEVLKRGAACLAAAAGGG